MTQHQPSSAIFLVALVALAACVLESNDQTRVVGEPCVIGDTCGPALMCFVPDHDPEKGTCIEPPEACDGDKSCDCLGELEEQCDTGLNCFGFVNYYTVGCAPGGQFRQLDQSCAGIVPCEPGLLCVMETFGEPGTCRPQPACFEGAGLEVCDCLTEEAKTLCPSGSGSCAVFGDIATLHCS